MAELSLSDSTPEKGGSGNDDKPNIVVNEKKEVHMKATDSSSQNEGSITIQNEDKVKTNPSKDPNIKPEKTQVPKDAQSKCCLLF